MVIEKVKELLDKKHVFVPFSVIDEFDAMCDEMRVQKNGSAFSDLEGVKGQFFYI